MSSSADEELRKLELELFGKNFSNSSSKAYNPSFAAQELRSLRMELESQIQECKRKAVHANQLSLTSMSEGEVGKAVEFTIAKKVNVKLVQHLEKMLRHVEKALDYLRTQD